jgi:hypothetical protein
MAVPVIHIYLLKSTLSNQIVRQETLGVESPPLLSPQTLVVVCLYFIYQVPMLINTGFCMCVNFHSIRETSFSCGEHNQRC